MESCWFHAFFFLLNMFHLVELNKVHEKLNERQLELTAPLHMEDD